MNFEGLNDDNIYEIALRLYNENKLYDLKNFAGTNKRIREICDPLIDKLENKIIMISLITFLIDGRMIEKIRIYRTSLKNIFNKLREISRIIPLEFIQYTKDEYEEDPDMFDDKTIEHGKEAIEKDININLEKINKSIINGDITLKKLSKRKHMHDIPDRAVYLGQQVGIFGQQIYTYSIIISDGEYFEIDN